MEKYQDIIDLIKNHDTDKFSKLLEHTPEIANSSLEQGMSLLQFAAYCRNQEALRLITKYKSSFTIFEYAILGNQEEVESLLEKDLSLMSEYSLDGFTLLGLSTFFGHTQLSKYLLEKGANPNQPSNNIHKVAPIHSACAIGNLELVKLLIKHGADVNAKQPQGVTPLHSAAHLGNTEIISVLAQQGADVNAKMDNSKTPLDMALEANFQYAVNLLKELGAR